MKCPRCGADLKKAQCPACGFSVQKNFASGWRRIFRKEAVLLFSAILVFVLCLFAFPVLQPSSDTESTAPASSNSNQRTSNQIVVSNQLRFAIAAQLSAAQADMALMGGSSSLILPENYLELGRDPDSFQNMSIACFAQVLYDPQYTDEGVYFVFRSASAKEDTPMLYGIAFWAGTQEVTLSDRSFVNLTGTIMGEYSFTDSYGYEDSCPAIFLTDLQQSSYSEIYAPSIAVLEFEDYTLTAGTCDIQLFKTEFAETETRFYVTIENRGNKPAAFSAKDCVVYQNNKKYAWQENLNADYPLFVGELQPDEKQDMILTFSALNSSEKLELQMYVTSPSGNRQAGSFILPEKGPSETSSLPENS